MSSPSKTLEGQTIAYSGAQSLGALSDGAVQDEEQAAANSTLEPVAIWCGNIPEPSSSESAIRLLFGRFGQIRRVIIRRKPSPAMSWCLITYRSSASVQAALATPVMAKGTDGTDVRVVVELPEIEKQLMGGASSAEPSPQQSIDSHIPPEGDAQAEIEARFHTNAESSAIPATKDGLPTPTSKKRRKRRTMSMPARRLSVVELGVRSSLSPDDTGGLFGTRESSSALAADQTKGRRLWEKVRQSNFRNKLAVAALFVQNDDENEKAAKQAIKDTLRAVRVKEISITTTLKGFAQLYNGEMRGLDYRFKTEASLFRKIMSRLDKAVADSALKKTPPPSPEDILASILDVLRYTVVFETRHYTSAVREMIHALKEHEYKQHRVKNFWGPGDGYQGINSVFVSPTGQAFELQFHTPESLSMKEEECHSSYAKFRVATDSRKMMQYWEEMVSLWDMVPVPDNVLEIPDVVQQKLEFDLSKLSETETAAIQHRKSIEQVCKYPVAELHSRAVKAEPEIGALMAYLMRKHGPGGSCEQKERRSAVRAQLSMLRQLVDDFIVTNDDEDAANTNNDNNAKSSLAGHSEDGDGLSRTTSENRRRAATMNDQSFGKIGVGVKLARNLRMASVDLKSDIGESKKLSKDATALPDESTVRDKLRSLELEFPPLKYKIVCNNEELYTTIVQGFLRDIAGDSDYDIFAVNNWWDDLEKFGAVSARFLAIRHGLRFEVTFHTQASWDASTEHNEYMRRKFDTVIKTDVLFTDQPHLVEQAKSQMRREEMWRERWARISVPDRALTIGTLRYAHIAAPEASVLNREAQQAVGNSHVAINRFQDAANKIRFGVRMTDGMHGNSSRPSHSSHADNDSLVGNAWVEIVGAFFEERKDVARMFDAFKVAYLANRGADHATWQPLASRFAALEQQMIRMEQQLTAAHPENRVPATKTASMGAAPTEVSSRPSILRSNSGQSHTTDRCKAADGSSGERQTRLLSFVPMIATSPASILSTSLEEPPNKQDRKPEVESPHGVTSAGSAADGSGHANSFLCPPTIPTSTLASQSAVGSTAASSAAVAAMLRATPASVNTAEYHATECENESDVGHEDTIMDTNEASLPELLKRLLRNQEAISRMARGSQLE